MKFCKDCKWAEAVVIHTEYGESTVVKEDAHCLHPEAARSRVTGRPTTKCHDMRNMNCTIAGLMWEPR